MKKTILGISALSLSLGLFSFQSTDEKKANSSAETFQVAAESFADLQLLRYQIPGFEELSLQQKKLAYYLYQAALSGRDMIYDQKDKNGILLRKTIENMYGTYSGNRDNPEWTKFQSYCGQFWFSNGNHHH